MTAFGVPARAARSTLEMLITTVHPEHWSPRAIELLLDRDALRPSDVVAIELRRMQAGVRLDEREQASALALFDELAHVRDLWFLDPVRAERYLELYELGAEDRRIALVVLLAELLDTVGHIDVELDAADLISAHGRGGRFEELLPWGPLSRRSRAWLRARRAPSFRASLQAAVEDEARALSTSAAPRGHHSNGARTPLGSLARRRVRRDIFAQVNALLPSEELPSVEHGSADTVVDELVWSVYDLQERFAGMPWASRDALGRRIRGELFAVTHQLLGRSAAADLRATTVRLRALTELLERFDGALPAEPERS